MLQLRSVALVSACLFASGAFAQTTYPETEPNDTRAQANGPFIMNSGDMITGTSTGQATSGGGLNTFDWFAIKPAPSATGIYRHGIVLTSSTLTQRFQLKGRSQFDSFPSSADAAVTFDNATGTGIQLHALAWYGFGHSEQVALSLFGATTSTQPYTLTLTTTPVTPQDIGTLPGGYITISSVGETTADTDFWVYDANFNPVPGFGNDDQPDVNSHPTTQSEMSKDMLVPGVYYLAISDVNLANDQLSPVGDRYPSKAFYDYPGVVSTQSAAQNVNVSFKIIDGDGVTHHYPATKPNSYDIVWIKFTIAAPATGACCLPNGTCAIASNRGCTAQGGTYNGNNTDCSNANCPQPPQGACCLLNGSCMLTNQYQCTAFSGAWRGAGSVCSEQNCLRTIDANPNIQNGAGGFSGAGGEFVDVIASGSTNLSIRRIDYYSTQSYNNATPLPVIDVYVRADGSYMSYEGGVGNPGGNTTPPPGSNWVLNSTVTTNPYPVGGSFTALPIILSTPVPVARGSVVGFYLVPRAAGIKAASTGEFFYSNSDMTLYSDKGRSFVAANAPGWATALTGNRIFCGRFFYTIPCPADFNNDTVVDFFDYLDFIDSFASHLAASDFNQDGTIDFFDYLDFVDAFSRGC